MLRCFYTGLLLVILVSCGQKKKPAADTANKPSVVPDKFSGLIPDKPIGYTSDFAHVFSPAEIFTLDSLCDAHKKTTTNEIAIVTIILKKEYVPDAGDFDSLSVRIMRHWGVGAKEKNNGVGIIISPAIKAISIRVGYGLEGKLTNAECKRIIDEIIVPSFKQGELFSGTRNGLEAVINEIK